MCPGSTSTSQHQGRKKLDDIWTYVICACLVNGSVTICIRVILFCGLESVCGCVRVRESDIHLSCCSKDK